MLKTNHEADALPKCFGDPKLFDRAAPECVGGHDPSHYNQNPSSQHFQSQVRDACDWVNQCSTRVQAQLIPAASLVRPQAPASPWSTKFTPPAQVPQSQPWKPQSPQFVPPHQQAQQFMSTTYGIPQYLSVREPQTSGGFGARLARESVRSILKSVGHTIAHFFDTEIFGGPPNDGGNPQGG